MMCGIAGIMTYMNKDLRIKDYFTGMMNNRSFWNTDHYDYVIDDTIIHNGQPLCRIIANKDLPEINLKKDTVGGYIGYKTCLFNSWVDFDSMVTGESIICNSTISKNSLIRDSMVADCNIKSCNILYYSVVSGSKVTKIEMVKSTLNNCNAGNGSIIHSYLSESIIINSDVDDSFIINSKIIKTHQIKSNIDNNIPF